MFILHNEKLWTQYSFSVPSSFLGSLQGRFFLGFSSGLKVLEGTQDDLLPISSHYRSGLSLLETPVRKIPVDCLLYGSAHGDISFSIKADEKNEFAGQVLTPGGAEVTRVRLPKGVSFSTVQIDIQASCPVNFTNVLFSFLPKIRSTGGVI